MYKVTDPKMYAKGSVYSSPEPEGYGTALLVGKEDYLCPECGGYGHCCGKACHYCKSKGTIPLNDIRVYLANSSKPE